MEIIGTSNFNNEMVNDFVVAENVDQKLGERMVHGLVMTTRDGDTYHFRLVDDEYKLHRFEP